LTDIHIDEVFIQPLEKDFGIVYMQDLLVFNDKDYEQEILPSLNAVNFEGNKFLPLKKLKIVLYDLMIGKKMNKIFVLKTKQCY